MPVSRRSRFVALAIVLVAQTLMFALFVPKPPRIEADNVRYETAGWELASGHGFSLPYEMAPDDDARQWACTRHPSWCQDNLVPSAIYAPGYGMFTGLVYLFAGRSLWALMLSQWALLLAMFVVFERLAVKSLEPPGYAFVMAIAATYPFLARQAGFVMSDHLHAALVLFGLAPLVLVRPGWWRGLAVGLLLAAATLTRPYSFVCLPLVIGALVWKREDDRWLHDVLGVCVGLALPMGTWIVRNSIVYGRFIPFTLSGLGTALYLNKIVWTVGDLYDPDNVRMTINEINRVAGADANSWQGNRALTEAALAWMRAHPLQVLASLPWRVVRMWINVGTSGVGVSRAWPLIGGYLGGLLAAGTAGMAYARKVRRLVPLVLFVLAYWAFLLHTPADARRTLPLRLPMLLFAGLAVDALWKGRVGAWLRSTSLARRFGTLVGATPQGKV